MNQIPSPWAAEPELGFRAATSGNFVCLRFQFLHIGPFLLYSRVPDSLARLHVVCGVFTLSIKI